MKKNICIYVCVRACAFLYVSNWIAREELDFWRVEKKVDEKMREQMENLYTIKCSSWKEHRGKLIENKNITNGRNVTTPPLPHCNNFLRIQVVHAIYW